MTLVVGKSKGNKQVNKNAAKEKSKDSNKNKRMAKIRNNLGGDHSRGKSKEQHIFKIQPVNHWS